MFSKSFRLRPSERRTKSCSDSNNLDDVLWKYLEEYPVGLIGKGFSVCREFLIKELILVNRDKYVDCADTSPSRKSSKRNILVSFSRE